MRKQFFSASLVHRKGRQTPSQAVRGGLSAFNIGV